MSTTSIFQWISIETSHLIMYSRNVNSNCELLFTHLVILSLSRKTLRGAVPA